MTYQQSYSEAETHLTHGEERGASMSVTITVLQLAPRPQLRCCSPPTFIPGGALYKMIATWCCEVPPNAPSLRPRACGDARANHFPVSQVMQLLVKDLLWLEVLTALSTHTATAGPIIVVSCHVHATKWRKTASCYLAHWLVHRSPSDE